MLRNEFERQPNQRIYLQLPDLRSSQMANSRLNCLEENLHEEIINFHDYISTKRQIKLPAIYVMFENLRELISNKFSDFELILYGSYASGLAIESSDVDLQVRSESFTSKATVRRAISDVGDFLKNKAFVTNFERILKTRVPILKLEIDLNYFDSIKQGVISVDISFDTPENLRSALASLNQTCSYLNDYPCLKYVMVVVKTFLSYRKLNDAYTGGISSYSLLLWMVSYIKSEKQNFENFGHLLLGFISYYGTVFDKFRQAVKPSSSNGFTRKDYSEEMLTVDPITGCNNTTKSAYQIDQVILALRKGYNNIYQTNKVSLNSLFKNN